MSRIGQVEVDCSEPENLRRLPVSPSPSWAVRGNGAGMNKMVVLPFRSWKVALHRQTYRTIQKMEKGIEGTISNCYRLSAPCTSSRARVCVLSWPNTWRNFSGWLELCKAWRSRASFVRMICRRHGLLTPLNALWLPIFTLATWRRMGTAPVSVLKSTGELVPVFVCRPPCCRITSLHK